LNKLRICGIHFPEDMLIPYTPKRRLRENALPSLYLPLQVDIAQDSANTISNANIDNSENVEWNPDLSILPVQEDNQLVQEETQHIQEKNQSTKEENQPQPIIHTKSIYNSDIHHLRNKLRHVKKMLHKKKAVIKKQRGQLNKLRHENKWEKITEDLPAVQRIFFEILSSNLHCAPQVCLKIFLKFFLFY